MNVNMSQATLVFTNTSSSNGTECESCGVAAAKYKCPGCSYLSCSVKCVQQHKLERNCTGVKNPYESLNNDDMLLHDYRFLESVKSKLESGLRNPMLHHLQNEPVIMGNKNRTPFNPAERNPTSKYFENLPCTNNSDESDVKIPNYVPRNPLFQHPSVLYYRKDIPIVLQRLRRKVSSRGTNLSFMPRHMQRRITNTTHYSPQSRSLKWHVQVKFLHANVFFEATVDENTTIGSIISYYLSMPAENWRGRTIDDGGIKMEHCNDESNDDFDHNSNIHDYNSEPKLSASVEPMDSVEVITTQLNPFCSLSDQGYTASQETEKPLVVDITPDKERSPPHELTEEQVQQMMFYQSAGLANLAVLCQNEDFECPRKYDKFELDNTLKDSLYGLRIIEYPILLVIRRDHVYEFIAENSSQKDEIDEIILKNTSSKPNSVALKYFDADCPNCDDN